MNKETDKEYQDIDLPDLQMPPKADPELFCEAVECYLKWNGLKWNIEHDDLDYISIFLEYKGFDAAKGEDRETGLPLAERYINFMKLVREEAFPEDLATIDDLGRPKFAHALARAAATTYYDCIFRLPEKKSPCL